LRKRGHSIPDLLSRKAGGYRGLDWRRLVNDDPYLPSDVRFSGVTRRSDLLFIRAAEDYGWDPAQFSSEAQPQRGDS
jgi:hypothetical protein